MKTPLKIISLIIVFSGVFFAFAYKTQPFSVIRSTSFSIPEDMKSIFEKIDQEEKRIMQEFEKMGIRKSAIEKQFNELYAQSRKLHLSHPYKNSPVVSSDIQFNVKNMIKDLPIDHNNLYILQTSMDTPAASVGNILLINEKEFKQHSPSAQRFIVTHEMAHNYYNDSFIFGILERLCKKNRFELENQDPKHPLCQLSRLTEWRADVWACAANQQVKTDYVNYCHEWAQILKQRRVRESTTHPTNNQRLQIAQALNNGKISSQTTHIMFA